jgi:two-component system sensor histidine kinase KdpD
VIGERVIPIAAAGRRHRRAVALTAFVLLLIVCVLVLLPFRGDENVGAIVLVMLLPPLVATGAGPVAAGVAALITGLAFNFFFTHPYESPAIQSTASVAAFGIYVVVALGAGVMVARVREARALADRRAADATLLQVLTVELIQNAEAAVTLRSALVELTGSLGLRGAFLITKGGAEEVIARAGAAEEAELLARRLVGRGETPRLTTLREAGRPAAFPITTVDGAFGFLVVDPGQPELGADRERFLESFAGVVALALTRARLADERVLRRTLEKTDQLRTVLLQSVSHDLLTPLTAIKTATASMGGTTVTPARREELLVDVEQEVDRLTHLVANLLDLSRIESGGLQLDRRRFPLDELVAEAVDITGRSDVEVVMPDDAPIVDADETLLRQVLVNLIENAARYASDSALRVEARADADAVEVRVIDHGPGIPEPERPRIFEPYNRPRPGLRGRGSGLGLAISRGFVEAHGGTLAVETTPGGGATFVLRLPARKESLLGA